MFLLYKGDYSLKQQGRFVGFVRRDRKRRHYFQLKINAILITIYFKLHMVDITSMQQGRYRIPRQNVLNNPLVQNA